MPKYRKDKDTRRLQVLLRDAQPAWGGIDGRGQKIVENQEDKRPDEDIAQNEESEWFSFGIIESEPESERERKDRERARDTAIDALVRIVRTGKFQGEKLGTLERLRVSSCIKGLMVCNGDRLPNPKGGRPQGCPARLRLAVAIWEAIETNSKKPKHEREKVSSVLEEVARRLGKKISYVREVYYDLDRSQRAVKAELVFSKENAEIAARRPKSKQDWVAWLATLLPSEYVQQLDPAAKALGMSHPRVLDIEVKLVQRAQRKKL